MISGIHMLPEKKSSPNLEMAHLRRAEELPQFRSVLEMWPAEKYRTFNQERIAVLNMEAGVIAMVATRA